MLLEQIQDRPNYRRIVRRRPHQHAGKGYELLRRRLVIKQTRKQVGNHRGRGLRIEQGEDPQSRSIERPVVGICRGASYCPRIGVWGPESEKRKSRLGGSGEPLPPAPTSVRRDDLQG